MVTLCIECIEPASLPEELVREAVDVALETDDIRVESLDNEGITMARKGMEKQRRWFNTGFCCCCKPVFFFFCMNKDTSK